MVNLDAIRARLQNAAQGVFTGAGNVPIIWVQDIATLVAEVERLRISERTILARLEFDRAGAQREKESLLEEVERLRAGLLLYEHHAEEVRILRAKLATAKTVIRKVQEASGE